MSDLFTALALVLVIEGILYALFPDTMKRLMLQVMDQPTSAVRTAGLTAAVLGVGLVWFVRRF